MDLRAAGRKSQQSWFSTDILKQLISGGISDKAEMDQDSIAFLKANITELQSRFAQSNAKETKAVCRDLEKQRSQRLFS